MISNFLLFGLLNYIDMQNIGSMFIVMKAAIEAIFLITAYKQKLSPIILNVFLISIVYNTFVFIEFNTRYDFIYRNYGLVMNLLTTALLLAVIKAGFKNGLDNSCRRNIPNNNDSVHRIHDRRS